MKMVMGKSRFWMIRN